MVRRWDFQNIKKDCTKNSFFNSSGWASSLCCIYTFSNKKSAIVLSENNTGRFHIFSALSLTAHHTGTPWDTGIVTSYAPSKPLIYPLNRMHPHKIEGYLRMFFEEKSTLPRNNSSAVYTLRFLNVEGKFALGMKKDDEMQGIFKSISSISVARGSYN